MPAKRKRCNTGENVNDCKLGGPVNAKAAAKPSMNKRSVTSVHLNTIEQNAHPSSKLQRISSMAFYLIEFGLFKFLK
jgi:hypothetical protein